MRQKNGLIIILLSMLMACNSIVIADTTTIESAIPDIDTDGSQSCVVWFQVFDNLLEDKVTNGLKLFLILSSLRQPSVENKVAAVLSSDIGRKNLLEKYGLKSDSIYFLINYYLSTFPENIDDVKYNYIFGENIYSDLFHDENFDYSKYMVRFYNYLNELFRQLPSEMQSIITKYDRKEAGEIVVMQGLMNIVISDYLAFETYNTLSNASISQSLHLRDNIRQPLINELVRVANDLPDGYGGDTTVDMVEIEEYIDAFMGLGNVVLESIELNLKENKFMKHAIELAGDSNLLVRSPYTPSQPLIEITLRMNTEFIELDSSDPLTTDYFNQFQLIPEVGGTSNPVVYTIDKPDIASVDENGLISLSTSKQGIARITATVQGYNVYKEIIVQVTEQTPLGNVQFYGPYISGYPDKTFKTQKNITRAEIATMMTRVLRLDVTENNIPISPKSFIVPSYGDVANDHWAYKYIELAKSNNLLLGYGDGSFRPDAPVSRAEMAVIISKGWDALGINQSEFSNHFIKDVDVSHWAFSAINQIYNAKIVSGYDDGTFRPNDFTTRGEIVVMINSVINRKNDDAKIPSFSDVPNDHWAYGFVEAATKMQVIQEFEETEIIE